MTGSITDVAGVAVGNMTRDRTGVTVVLLPEGTTASCEVRGGAPASRETALLEPTKLVEHADAIVLTGGSAFGLATADGVMTFLAMRGRGFRSTAGPVPIVPTAAIFDLVASEGAHPTADDGAAAAAAAVAGAALETGRVGAGTGATVGKWRGAAHGVPGGLGAASVRVGDATIGALAVVNAVGDVVADDGSILAGSTAPPGTGPYPDPPLGPGESTTLVVVATDARCSKVGCQLLAQSAHDGLARAVRPVATRFDGDIAFAAATGVVEAHFDRLRLGVVDAVAAAVRSSVA
ncbi:MAG TPA: P1 family peptidase [Acidimicrobiia bacterium]